MSLLLSKFDKYFRTLTSFKNDVSVFFVVALYCSRLRKFGVELSFGGLESTMGVSCRFETSF